MAQNLINGNIVTTFGMGKKVYLCRYVVVDITDIINSNDVMGRVNPRYNVVGVQPRNRSDKANLDQVLQLSLNFDAIRYVWPSVWIDRGAIIVENISQGHAPIFKNVVYQSPKERVNIAGNGRYMGLDRIFNYFPDKWQDFQNVQRELVGAGFVPGVSLADLAQHKNPLVVRELVNQHEIDLVAFAQEANGDDKAGLSLPERARIYAQYVNEELLSMLVVGDNLKETIRLSENEDFLSNFYSSLPDSDKNEIQGSTGDICDIGLMYLEATLCYVALSASPKVDKFLEQMSALQDDAASFTGGVINAAPNLAKINSLMAQGKLSADYGIADNIVRIMLEILDMKSNRTTVKKFLESISVLPTLTHNERELVKCLYSQSEKGQYRIKSANQIGELLSDWAEAAIAQTRRGVLPVVPRHELLGQVFRSDWCKVNFQPETIQPIAKPEPVKPVVTQAVAKPEPVKPVVTQPVKPEPVKPVVTQAVAKPEPVKPVITQPVAKPEPNKAAWQWQNEILQVQCLAELGRTQFRLAFVEKSHPDRALFDERLNRLKVVVFKATGQSTKWDKPANCHFVSVMLTTEQVKQVMEAVAEVKLGGVKLNNLPAASKNQQQNSMLNMLAMLAA